MLRDRDKGGGRGGKASCSVRGQCWGWREEPDRDQRRGMLVFRSFTELYMSRDLWWHYLIYRYLTLRRHYLSLLLLSYIKGRKAVHKFAVYAGDTSDKHVLLCQFTYYFLVVLSIKNLGKVKVASHMKQHNNTQKAAYELVRSVLGLPCSVVQFSVLETNHQ